MARMLFLEGERAGDAIELADGQTIGRLPGCDVVLDHPSISRRHARVERRGDALWLVDLGSSNGLRVAGQRIPEVLVEDGLALAVGAVEVHFAVADPADEPLEEDFDFADGASAAPPAVPPPAVPPPAVPPDAGLALEDPAEIELAAAAPPRRRPGAPEASARTPDAEPAASSAPAPLERRRAELVRTVASEPTGLLRGDLTQYPAWVQALAWLLVLAVFAGVAWGAFALVQGAKG